MKKRISRCIDQIAMKFENYPENHSTSLHNYHSVPKPFFKSVETNGGCVGVEIEMAFPQKPNGCTVFCNSLDSNMIWASTDSSISGMGALEICTVPLMEHDATSPKFWEPITKRLVALGARSYDNGTTGLHIHIDRKKFKTQKSSTEERDMICARTLYGLYVQDAPWKRKIFQRQGSSSYAKNNIVGELMKTIQTILPEAIKSKACVDRLIEEAYQSCRDRYSEFNTTPNTTLEFRCGKGTLNPKRIAAIAEFCLLFARYCRSYGARIPQTSQKHFEAFIHRHAKSDIIKQAINPSQES
jgi:hypothetical protein